MYRWQVHVCICCWGSDWLFCFCHVETLPLWTWISPIQQIGSNKSFRLGVTHIQPPANRQMSCVALELIADRSALSHLSFPQCFSTLAASLDRSIKPFMAKVCNRGRHDKAAHLLTRRPQNGKSAICSVSARRRR